MAPIEHISTEVHTENGDTVVVTATRPGEFVVCNLASLSLGNLPVEDEAYMERTVETAIRALDNVIDLNFYPLEYARLTNQKYRSIGLGGQRLPPHAGKARHPLGERGAPCLHRRGVRAHQLRRRQGGTQHWHGEKGRYALFEGSDWQTGAYFEKRGLYLRKVAGACGKRWRCRNAQRLSAGGRTDLQHIYPLRHVGGHRSNYEEILLRGEKGQHAAPRCPGAFYGYMVVL